MKLSQTVLGCGWSFPGVIGDKGIYQQLTTEGYIFWVGAWGVQDKPSECKVL
jgi:hypothetical protein